MTTEKFIRSRLIVDLSAKVAHMGQPSICLNIFFSVTTRPSEVEFHMGYLGRCHMTKMATMKYSLKGSSWYVA